MPDHVHLLIDLGRESSVSKVLREIKSKSSAWLREKLENDFSWQSGYGVVSFGTKDLERVVNYVRNQKEHHAKGTMVERFERTDDEEAKAHSAEAR